MLGNWRKQGQLGLLDIFSYILYFIAFLVILLLLNIQGCKEKVQSDIGIDANFRPLEASVRADAQLNSYLRTQMPEKELLFTRIGWLEAKQKGGFVFAKGFDLEKAKDFLERYPEVYDGKDYSEFISSLQAVYESDVKEKEGIQEAFKAATAAMFLRAVEDDEAFGGTLYYFLPIGVDFDNLDKGKPGDEKYLCGTGKYELCTDGYLPDEFFYIVPVSAVQITPLADGEMAKVELRYVREFRARLPKP